MRAWLNRLLHGMAHGTTTRPAIDPTAAAGSARSAEAFYSEVAQRKLDAQLADIKSIEQGFFSYFSIGSTILPITAGFISSDSSEISRCVVAKIALVGAFSCYLLFFAILISSLRISKWDSRPLLSQWQEVTQGRTEVEMQRWLGDACTTAYANNEPILEQRAGRSGRSRASTGIGPKT